MGQNILVEATSIVLNAAVLLHIHIIPQFVLYVTEEKRLDKSQE